MEIYCQQRKSVYINGNKSKILKGIGEAENGTVCS